MKDKGRSFPARAASFVARRPSVVLLIGLAAVILGVMAAQNIEMKTKIEDMLPADNPQVMSYTEIDDLFNGGSTVLITIRGVERAQLLAAAESLTDEVRGNQAMMDLTRSVYHGLDEEFIRKWGLLLQDPDAIERTVDLYRQTDLLSYITALNDSVEEAWTGDEPDEELENFRQEAEAVAWLNQVDRGLALVTESLESLDPGASGDELAQLFSIGDLNEFNDDGTMLLVTIVPNFNAVEFEKIEVMMAEVRDLLDRMRQRYPDLEFAYTGDVPIQSDEQDAMSFDMLVPTLVAVVLILLLFIASFPRIGTIFYLIVTLAAGIILTYGFLGITIKEVNMLTSVLGVLLVGLGVDYGIQFASNYRTYRKTGLGIAAAMGETYQRAGVGVVLAAVTTSVAFFVMAATGTMAFRQFGFVLGCGILMCLLVMATILPAFLVISDRGREKRFKRRIDRARKRGEISDVGDEPANFPKERPVLEFKGLTGAAALAHKHRRPVLIIAAVLTLGLGTSAVGLLRMNYDLMDMEPQDMPSIVAYRDIMDAFGITPFHSMVVADDVSDARELVDALEGERQVADLASVSDLIRSDDDQKAALEALTNLKENPPTFDGLPWTAEDVSALAGELQRLEWNVIEMADLSVAGLGDGNRIQSRRDAMIREIFGAEIGKPGREVFQTLIGRLEADPEGSAAALTRLDEKFAPALASRIQSMASADRIVTVDDLPEEIARRFFADDGVQNLVYIYPKDGMMESGESMRRFNDDLAQVDERITGSAQISVAWLDIAVRSTLLSALYIFLAVLVFLAIMLRNAREVLRAVVPLVVGMIWMLGLYGIFGLSLNLLNLVVIPLVIGMGIDFGIHLTHRYRVESNLDATYRTTGKAVFLSGATTLIGFGSLALIGKFPSIASMGSILTFGIATCLAAAFLVLPALLENKPRHTESGSDRKEISA